MIFFIAPTFSSHDSSLPVTTVTFAILPVEKSGYTGDSVTIDRLNEGPYGSRILMPAFRGGYHSNIALRTHSLELLLNSSV